MDTWVQVDKLKDGDSVDAKTLNVPVDQLASRTEYLKRKLGTMIDEGVQSALILHDVDFASDDADKIAIGTVVYRADDGFRRAQAKMHLYDNFTADEAAFTIGIVVAKTDQKGDVLIYGKLDIGADRSMNVDNMLQVGEAFREGRYYLSATEPGRITSKPSGPLIYIGSFHPSATSSGGFAADAVAYVNPQFLDIGTSHVHRAYTLMARPAGSVVDGSVIGYLPDASDPTTKEILPTLVFGGTWTSTNDVSYVFTLDNSSAWGSVTLRWCKNGDTSRYYEVGIPAPDVFVGLDNGLKVKIRFPEADKSNAWVSDLSDAERTWTLDMPYAGKGWVDHSVDAVASEAGSAGLSETCGVLNPGVYAAISGSWPDYDNTMFLLFPEKLYTRNVSASTRTIAIDGVTYEFVEAGEQPERYHVPIQKAATVEETLHNLAKTVNDASGRADLLVRGSTLVSTGPVVQSSSAAKTGADFDVVGGVIPLLVAYDADFYVIGDIKENEPTYKKMRFGNLSVTVFAADATSSSNYTCRVGTVIYATAYDYAPEAIYDYAMGLHQEVDYYFPPVPAQAAGLFVNGVEVENAALFPDNPTYVIGRKTLHWMEESADHRPWPEGVTSHDDVVDPADDKTMAFYFIVGFQCASGPVTSLVPAPGSSVKMYTYGTNDEAYTGDLMIDLGLDLQVASAGVKGFNVAKQGKGGKLLAGPVVEKIRAGNGILVTQASGCPAGQGTVTISLDDGTTRNSFSEIALENAKQEKLGLFPYISLLGWGAMTSNIPSAFTMMMRVPTSLDPDKDYQLQLRVTMFGAVDYAGTPRRAAGIQLEYNILPDYTGDTHRSLKTGLVAPDNPRIIAVPLGHWTSSRYEYVAYDPFVATTEDDGKAPKSDDVCVPFSSLPIPSAEELGDFKLKPGYLVAIRISRTNPPGSIGSETIEPYTGPVGFLSMEWTLEEV